MLAAIRRRALRRTASRSAASRQPPRRPQQDAVVQRCFSPPSPRYYARTARNSSHCSTRDATQTLRRWRRDCGSTVCPRRIRRSHREARLRSAATWRQLQSRGASSDETRIHRTRFHVEFAVLSYASGIHSVDRPRDWRERPSADLAVETASSLLHAATRLHDGEACSCAMRIRYLRSRRRHHRTQNATRDRVRNSRRRCAEDRIGTCGPQFRAATPARRCRHRSPSPPAPRLISHRIR